MKKIILTPNICIYSISIYRVCGCACVCMCVHIQSICTEYSIFFIVYLTLIYLLHFYINHILVIIKILFKMHLSNSPTF